MKHIFTGTLLEEIGEGKEVSVLVHDLDAFLKAAPEASIFVVDEAGNSFEAKKGDVHFEGASEA